MVRSELFRIIDEYVGSKGEEGVVDIIDALTDAMYATAEHLETDWQDRKSASFWIRWAKKIEKSRSW